MRLEEEKLITLLEVGGILILLSTVLTQVSEYKINEYEEDLFLDFEYVNSVLADYNLIHLYFIQFQVLDLEELKTNTSEFRFSDEQLNTFTKEYLNGKISDKKYKERVNIFYTKSLEDRYKLYYTRASALQEKVARGSSWMFWRKFSIIITVLLALLNILGYLNLHKKISGRYEKNN